MPQNATQNEEPEILTPQQIAALERLLAGETVTATAEAVGIDRSTLHRWLREDYLFQALLNQAKRELADATRVRLLRAADKAAEVVGNAVDQGNLNAALAVLKGLGALSGMAVTPGLEDPEVLRQAAVLAQEEAELARAELKQSRLMRRLTVS